MAIFIDCAVKDKCYNPFESYGELCVGCGCCSKDREKRTRARMELYQRLLDKWLHFDGWDDDPDMRALQEKNVKFNIKWCKRRLAYYRGKLAGMQRTTKEP